MMINLFILFISISLVLTLFGFIADIPLFTFAGAIMIFLLGLNLLTTGLDYKTGENITIITDAENITTQTVQNTYSSYDDSTNRFGWYILMLGALAFILGLFSLGD